MKHDNQIIRSAKQLTQKECANYADGACVPEDCPCHLINPAYKTIHDGAIDCDWFVQVVLPLQPELLTAYWHEIFREEGQAGTGWKALAAISLLSPAATGSNTAPSAQGPTAKPGTANGSAAIASARRTVQT